MKIIKILLFKIMKMKKIDIRNIYYMYFFKQKLKN